MYVYVFVCIMYWDILCAIMEVIVIEILTVSSTFSEEHLQFLYVRNYTGNGGVCRESVSDFTASTHFLSSHYYQTEPFPRTDRINAGLSTGFACPSLCLSLCMSVPQCVCSCVCLPVSSLVFPTNLSSLIRFLSHFVRTSLFICVCVRVRVHVGVYVCMRVCV